MKIGYVRINPEEDDGEALLKKFEETNQLQRVYWEQLSVKEKNRPEYDKMMEYLREGDELVLLEFARFNRTLLELVRNIENLNAKGITVVSIKENFDSSTEEGKFKFEVFQTAAEFEKTLMKQRQREGVARAQAEGKYKGNNRKEVPEDFEGFRKMYYTHEISVTEIAEHYQVSRPTIYSWLKKLEKKSEGIQKNAPTVSVEEKENTSDTSISDSISDNTTLGDELDQFELGLDQWRVESANGAVKIVDKYKVAEKDLEITAIKEAEKTGKATKVEKTAKLPEDFEAFRRLYHDGVLAISDIMIFYNKSRTTIVRWMKLADAEFAEKEKRRLERKAKREAKKKAKELQSDAN